MLEYINFIIFVVPRAKVIRAAQKVQRLQHALVLVLGQQDHGAGILARNMKSRATVAHLVHELCQMLSKGAVGNVPH